MAKEHLNHRYSCMYPKVACTCGYDDELEENEQIQGKIVRIFVTRRNEELNEGRGKIIDDSYFTDRNNAIIGAKGIDVMGTDGHVEERLVFKNSNGKYYLLNLTPLRINPLTAVQKEALRKQALEKLTPAERIALGV